MCVTAHVHSHTCVKIYVRMCITAHVHWHTCICAPLHLVHMHSLEIWTISACITVAHMKQLQIFAVIFSSTYVLIPAHDKQPQIATPKAMTCLHERAV